MPPPHDFAFVATGTAGIVLAAGGGKRFGGPKALATSSDGTSWLANAARSLLGGGCAPVIVVLGAAADEAEALLTEAFATADDDVDDVVDHAVRVVRSADWETGMAASLRAGLLAADDLDPRPVAVAVVTVDVPSLNAATVRRLVAPVPGPVGPATLRQAFFSGAPGHPVVIGREHWGALIEQLHGDVGARPYLRAHGAAVVECSDLGSGSDIDTRDRTP